LCNKDYSVLLPTPFFPIDTQHVNTVNGILPDNAYVCSSVVFKSIKSFSHTLGWFLTESCAIGKVVTGEYADLRLTCLENLATVSQSLGSEKKPVWREEPVHVVQDLEKFRLMKIEQSRLFGKIIENDQKSTTDTEYMQIYKTLRKSLRISFQLSLVINLFCQVDRKKVSSRI
jgi:hypothetical protein